MKRYGLLVLLCAWVVNCLMAQNTAFGHGGKATGGGNATPTLVDTYDELQHALSSSEAKLIIITKNISFLFNSLLI